MTILPAYLAVCHSAIHLFNLQYLSCGQDKKAWQSVIHSKCLEVPVYILVSVLLSNMISWLADFSMYSQSIKLSVSMCSYLSTSQTLSVGQPASHPTSQVVLQWQSIYLSQPSILVGYSLSFSKCYRTLIGSGSNISRALMLDKTTVATVLVPKTCHCTKKINSKIPCSFLYSIVHL